MITIKKWTDFDTDRARSGRAAICYGAGRLGTLLLYHDLLTPRWFCDINADSIEFVVNSVTGKVVPCLAPHKLVDALRRENVGADVFVAIMNRAVDHDALAKELCEYFKRVTGDVNIYMPPLRANANINIGGISVLTNFAFAKHIYSHAQKDAFRSGVARDTYSEVIFKDGLFQLAGEAEFISDGKRITTGQPATFEKKIHVFGGSHTFGVYVDNENTFCSVLQKLFNENDSPFCVENHGMQGLLELVPFQAKNTPIRAGDIVVYAYLIKDRRYAPDVMASNITEIKKHCEQNGCIFVMLTLPYILDRKICSEFESLVRENYERMEDYAGLMEYRASIKTLCLSNGVNFFDFSPEFYYDRRHLLLDYGHLSDWGHDIVGRHLFSIVRQLTERRRDEAAVNREKMEALCREFAELFSKSIKGVDLYAEKIKQLRHPDCGNAAAVVVNCNPFTKGHRRLIEYAAGMSEWLYVFVVEEDRSEFTFDERFALVEAGTADLPNVTVIPSGEFIISSFVFPDYFNKDTLNGSCIAPDTDLDLLIFAIKIAPAMAITRRFVGEEPFDAVTRAYNENMKRILPEWGIEVEEMPRLSLQGQIVSASAVREAAKRGDFESVRALVPQRSFDALVRKYGSSRQVDVP